MRKITLSYIILTISILLTVGYVAAQQSHPHDEITLPGGVWPDLNADLLDSIDSGYITSRLFWQLNTGNDIRFTLGNVTIGSNSQGYTLYVSGDAYVTRSVIADAFLYSSDARLKTDVNEISSPLEKVLQLEGVTFRWKDSGEPGMGLIAQDVEKVFPEIVSTDQESGMKSVGYGNLVAPLIEAIKEQQGQIEQLREEIESLKSEC